MLPIWKINDKNYSYLACRNVPSGARLRISAYSLIRPWRPLDFTIWTICSIVFGSPSWPARLSSSLKPDEALLGGFSVQKSLRPVVAAGVVVVDDVVVWPPPPPPPPPPEPAVAIPLIALIPVTMPLTTNGDVAEDEEDIVVECARSPLTVLATRPPFVRPTTNNLLLGDVLQPLLLFRLFKLLAIGTIDDVLLLWWPFVSDAADDDVLLVVIFSLGSARNRWQSPFVTTPPAEFVMCWLLKLLMFWFVVTAAAVVADKPPMLASNSSSRFVIDLRQCSNHVLCSISSVPPRWIGNALRGTCRLNVGTDTVKTRSRNFSRTKRRRILNGALNHSGAVTMRTFFSRAG